MIPSKDILSWISKNLQYDGIAGTLTRIADGSSAIVVRRGRLKVRCEELWLDAASVCWYLIVGWPQFGVKFTDPDQSQQSILRRWNLRLRTRKEFKSDEQVVTNREFMELVKQCVMDQYRILVDIKQPTMVAAEKLQDLHEVMHGIDSLLKK